MGASQSKRCVWCGDDPQYVEYHDRVWGRPVFDSQELFAKLCLDGQQAGLSWITILRKQARYEEVYYGFDPEKIVRYIPRQQEKILKDPGIIRNRLKVASIIKNARGFIALRDQGIEFRDFLWDFVHHKPLQNSFKEHGDIPTETQVSRDMSKALKKAGFTFVGPTICYAFMQAVGMVNDHVVDCPQYEECRGASRS